MWNMREIAKKGVNEYLKKKRKIETEGCYLLLQILKYREEHCNKNGKMLIFANRMGKGVMRGASMYCYQNWFLRHSDKEKRIFEALSKKMPPSSNSTPPHYTLNDI